jgi:hypothetical protein
MLLINGKEGSLDPREICYPGLEGWPQCAKVPAGRIPYVSPVSGSEMREMGMFLTCGVLIGYIGLIRIIYERKIRVPSRLEGLQELGSENENP